ncbi:Gfo/Idh/MocA family protein [Gulosibacter sp. 10]|uniref:Gfo/Idh/MocA family protein n=1 Tax=Gulosibacter sp. 10 TaxID=1255570 RepID=UPI00097EFE11|nr:Gfo/Idh/MocA family oxidoreductase [Gulosibacter sp. 10]SJM71268.1 Myo-inositol 2-dehydrogenase [Gulosibacter sp. 10]
MTKLRVALVGAGMAGQAHAFGYRNASMADDLAGLDVELAVVADTAEHLARDVQSRYGFAEATADIRRITEDPSIDAVSVALPNFTHEAVLEPLIRSGKHILTEKPLGADLAQARHLAALGAEHPDAVHGVGFSYRRIPALAEMARIVRSGELGDVWHFEASYYCDHAAPADYPYTWRFDHAASGGGALMDLGIHVLDAVSFAVSPIEEVVSSQLRTVIPQRPDREGEMRPVTNDDVATMLVRTASGASGAVTTSRVAHGRPNRLMVSAYCSGGFASFDTEHYNDLTILPADGSDQRIGGPRTVVIGPENPRYSDVSSFRSRGVNTGYGEAFIAEVQDFLRAILGVAPMPTTFETAVDAMRLVQSVYDAHGVRR